MTDRELMQKALGIMEWISGLESTPLVVKSEFLNALRARLAQPEPEPVFAFRRKGLDDFCTCSEDRYNELAQKPSLFEVKKFYTVPPQREWQGLTEEDIAILWKATPQLVGVYSYTDISREVEAKLKEKNT